MTHRFALLAVAALGVALGGADAARAQAYPSGRVTMVVPFAPGGPTDLVARTVMNEVEKGWNQTVVIENRPGAGGLTGSAYVTQQKPDGHTLLLQGSVPKTAKLFLKDVPLDANELRAVSSLGQSSYLLSVNPSLGVKTLAELVKLAKSKPKDLNYGVIPLNVNELDYYVFERAAGIQLTPIAYQSAAPIIPALLRGDVTVYMGIVSLLVPQVEAGKVTAIAYVGPERHPRLPNVPTAKEAGVDFVTGYTLGIYTHSKTPEDSFQKLSRDIAAALKSPNVISALDKAGFQMPANPLGWGAQIERELAVYTDVARSLNYQPK
jgi:tripartite-type tricarboxylate transporter receptor subunit TctC